MQYNFMQLQLKHFCWAKHKHILFTFPKVYLYSTSNIIKTNLILVVRFIMPSNFLYLYTKLQ